MAVPRPLLAMLALAGALADDSALLQKPGLKTEAMALWLNTTETSWEDQVRMLNATDAGDEPLAVKTKTYLMDRLMKHDIDLPSLTIGMVVRMIRMALPGIHFEDPDIPGLYQVSVTDVQRAGSMLKTRQNYRQELFARVDDKLSRTRREVEDGVRELEQNPPTDEDSFLAYAKANMHFLSRTYDVVLKFVKKEKEDATDITNEFLDLTRTVPDTLPDDIMEWAENASTGYSYYYAKMFEGDLTFETGIELLRRMRRLLRGKVEEDNQWIRYTHLYENYAPTLIRLTCFMMPWAQQTQLVRLTTELAQLYRRALDHSQSIQRKVMDAVDRQSTKLGYGMDMGAFTKLPEKGAWAEKHRSLPTKKWLDDEPK